MQVTEKLHLSLPVRRDEHGKPTLYAYHTPISREVFESNYRVISATKAELFARGVAFAADTGPRIAALRLRDEAKRDAEERGIEGDGAGALLAEIKRLTTILAPGVNGWDMLPVDIAIQRGVIDAEDWREAEHALVFFTCAYALAPRANRQQTAEAIASVMRASISAFSALDYGASLQTWTPAAITAPPATSSVPS